MVVPMRRFKPRPLNIEGGFTLIELLVTIALIAIVSGIAVPSFSGLIRENRLSTSTVNLNTALRLARSEAIKRNQQIVLCGIDKCDGDFSAGWQLTTAIANGSTLHQYRFGSGSVSATGDGPIMFNPLGELASGSAQCIAVSGSGISQAIQALPSGGIRSIGACP
ncbi:MULTISPECIES: GspH/FimT family pseudopilin [Modicisalibacter]|uniref:GspH/FimT family pseudopilin n=1 Tax=Modicisalibacter TaxID=574347 RepID=UPI00100B4646|nr:MULTISPECIES: GspH/FimT family pseudopilin [Halomonadaceae]